MPLAGPSLQQRSLASGQRSLSLCVRAAKGGKQPPPKPKQVKYGTDWYEATRSGGRQFRTVREEIDYRRLANEQANNGKERKDLYTANWDGAEYKGSKVNVLTVIAAIAVLAPLIGLWFALQTYGTLWG